MPLTQADVLARLAAGDFDALIGELESDWLECKQTPYQLQRDRHKLELAKDVSGFANASGGLILIGFATVSDLTHGADRINAVGPVPLAAIDVPQYTSIIQDWTYPALTGIKIATYRSVTVPTHGVVCIEVPKIDAADWPVLVVKTLLDSDRQTNIIFGYCERIQATVSHYDVSRLQSLLRDGRRLDSELRDGLQSLHAMIEEIRDRQPIPEKGPAFDAGDVEQRMGNALQDVGLSDAPAFIIAAIPGHKLNVRELFESKTARLVQLLERPEEIRNAGFDLSVDGDSHIVKGTLRRSSYQGLKLLEMHRDGLIFFITRGDQRGLCWGRENQQVDKNLINQVFLIETVNRPGFSGDLRV